MKTILLFLYVFLSSLLLGQTWKYSEGGNAFDGKYKTSSIKGKGTDYPYNSPALVVNKFEGEDFNFYLSNAGYFQEDTGIGILWVFDNEPNTIYSTYDFSISNDGKILFFNEFNNPDGSLASLKSIEFIEKLTLANKVSIRVKNNYGSNDMVFSLSGSSKAINFVLPKEQREKMIKEAIVERDIFNESQSKKQLLFDSLMSVAKEYKLSSSSLSSMKSSLQSDMGMDIYAGFGNISDEMKIKTLDVRGEIGDAMFESYGYVSVYYIFEDGSEKEIIGTWKVDMDSPLMILMQKERARGRAVLESFLQKYRRNDLIEALRVKITKQAEDYNQFSLSEINDLKIKLTNYYDHLASFSYCNVDITLNDGSNEIINLYLSTNDIKISREDLQEMGGQEGVPF